MYYSLKFSIDLQYFIFIDWLSNLGWLETHYVTQVAWNSQSSCLSFLNAEITGKHLIITK